MSTSPSIYDLTADIEAIAARCDRVFAKLQTLAAADQSAAMTAALASLAALDFDSVTDALERAA